MAIAVGSGLLGLSGHEAAVGALVAQCRGAEHLHWGAGGPGGHQEGEESIDRLIIGVGRHAVEPS